MSIRIGILKETKNPPDKRVPLTPEQCVEMMRTYPGLEMIVQPSPVRSFTDDEYVSAGVKVKDDISDCDVLLGIKEVKKETLLPDKKYLFFSHTIKKQPHNRELLKAILKHKIQLIDYECLTDDKGNRIIGFGRYAGIIGAYNGIRAYGLKYKLFQIKPAYLCESRAVMNKELEIVKLPNVKIAVTGGGRVANGVIETLGVMKLRKVTPYEFIMFSFNEPVYCQLHSKDYYEPKNGSSWNAAEYYSNPSQYRSVFNKFTEVADLFISAHYWDPSADKLFTGDDMKSERFRIKVIADITCDIDGSVPSTIRATSIEDPCYDIDPQTGEELPAFSSAGITVMAVDNLPCELPRDASEGFGKELIEKVFPSLIVGDKSNLISRATIAQNGKLSPSYQYLSDYVSM